MNVIDVTLKKEPGNETVIMDKKGNDADLVERRKRT